MDRPRSIISLRCSPGRISADLYQMTTISPRADATFGRVVIMLYKVGQVLDGPQRAFLGLIPFLSLLTARGQEGLRDAEFCSTLMTLSDPCIYYDTSLIQLCFRSWHRTGLDIGEPFSSCNNRLRGELAISSGCKQHPRFRCSVGPLNVATLQRDLFRVC